MLTTFCLLLLLVASALAYGGGLTYRELACRVVDEAGMPVRGVTVRLGGLERDAPDSEDDEDRVNREPGWKFTTDANGCFTARFGRFHLYEHLDPRSRSAGNQEWNRGEFSSLLLRDAASRS